MAEEVKEEVVTAENLEQNSQANSQNNHRSKPKKDFKKDGRGRRDNHRDDGIESVTVSIRRVIKVVKGGRTFRFSAFVVAGDKKGKIGIGIGKAKEVALAIEKALSVAKKHMQQVEIVNGTISHEIIGKFGTSKILLLPAKQGTGIIAGGSARAVLELAGFTDVVTKVRGSSNKINVVKATFDGLEKMQSKEQIAKRRNKAIEDM